jgi:asparagine synthase (glutamine-hydrolysing)
MCGISVIVGEVNSIIEQGDIKAITDKIIHRGPDAEGYYFFENVAFGHRRLSILDLSDAGSQPMEYRKNYIITYNGEIYNYVELRDELKDLGYTFESDSDTEVILAAYCEWGYNCLDKFNGMFAFAILDKIKKDVFLARDRFGVKPLYYSQNSGKFVCGSELKQLIKEKNNKVNIDVLTEYMLTNVDNHTMDTYFDGIYSLLPGHFMVFDINTTIYTIEKWYFLNKIEMNKNIKEATGLYKKLFDSSIGLRLRSDVKVGTCLSGGLDSSSIAAIASKLYSDASNERFTAIHAKSVERESDESHYAKLVAEAMNLELHIVTPSTKEFINLIDEVVYTQEEPFPDTSIFMSYFVSKKAKEIGCKVLLNGQGGDEVLLGYERYLTAPFNNLNIFSFFKQFYLQSNKNSLKLGRLFLMYIYFNSLIIRTRSLKRKSYLKNKIKSSFNFNTLKESSNASNNVVDFQIYEITNLQLPHLLRYEDRNSMRNSIESRVPFLDYRIVEAGISFPLKHKIFNGWTKYILRKSMDNILPKEITWRKSKLGFNAPDKTWLEGYSDTMLSLVKKSDLLNEIAQMDELVKEYHTLPITERWKYYNIAKWEKIFDVKLGNDFE